MSHTSWGRGSLAGLLAISLASPVSAQAQTADDPQEARAADASIELPAEATPEVETRAPPRRVIEEIIVTATKREESLRDIAASIAAISGEQLENAGLQDVDDIVAAVPGVNIQDPNNGAAKRITIRGISSSSTSLPATSGVFIGETPFTDAGTPRVNLDANPFDMASVEVLKGPVGTLFGGSGLNGAIRYLPQQPALGEWEAKGFAEVRSFRFGDTGSIFGAAVNIPLLSNDTLALRLVGFDRKTAGYVDSTHPRYTARDVNATEQNGLRGILRWEPYDALSLSLMVIDQSTQVQDIDNTDNPEGRLERGDTPRASPRFSAYQLASLTGTWAFGWAEAVLNVAQIDKQLDYFLDSSNRGTGGLPPPDTLLGLGVSGGGKPRVQELRLVSTEDGGNWDWLAGAFNYDYRLSELSTLGTRLATLEPLGPLINVINALNVLPPGFVDENGNPFAVFIETDAKVSETALFGETNWRFAPTFQLTLGLRLYEFAYDTLLVSRGVGASLSNPLSPVRAEVNPRSTERGINPKFSLRWEPSNDLMTYLTVARGFRFGGTNLVAHPEIPDTYDSDFLWNYELGVRSSWFGNSLIADTAVFFIDWTDAQFGRATTDGVFRYSDNIGAVEGRGFEALLTWLPPLDGLTLSTSLAYADIRTAEAFEGVAAGTQWPLAPKWQTSTSVAWAGQLGTNQLRASLTHLYNGSARGELINDIEIFGYQTYNMQFTLDNPSLPWLPQFALNLNNLTDERGVVFINTFAGDAENYIAPRNVSLRLTFNY